MVTVKFTRTFTGGLLNGLVGEDSIRFVSVERAREWLAVMTTRGGGERFGSPFIVTAFTIEEAA